MSTYKSQLQVDLNQKQLEQLKVFLDKNKERMNPYQGLEYNSLMNRHFNYKNLSLVCFDERQEIKGYVSQYQKGSIVESVPWRDRGGPICFDDLSLESLILKTREVCLTHQLKGFLWRDTQITSLSFNHYFKKVVLNTEGLSKESYWESLSSKVKGKIKAAQRLGVIVNIVKDPSIEMFNDFYNLFEINRKNLGVPVYSRDYLLDFFHAMQIKGARFAYAIKDKMLAAKIILDCNNIVIDCFSASNNRGKKYNANDVLLFECINYAILNRAKKFDFGADSPLQISLLEYKQKWLGSSKKQILGEVISVINSQEGEFTESDHNSGKFNIAKKVISSMPMSLYRLFSRWYLRL
ncbi:MAG: GNAT family N-acetyltransferase [Bdellovibrionales bacterium]|nr:GNAT family N-acetyltransferase [Bdellovibrionales bacterium]